MLFHKILYSKWGSIKYFIGYANETDAFPAPLFIKLSHMNRYTKYFDNNNKEINILAMMKNC